MWNDSSKLILHGEDDKADARVVQRMLDKRDFAGKYENLPKGDEIIERVLQTGAYAGQELENPDLILLDIGLPVRTGTEVLKELRSHERSRGTPIIMLSGSSSVRDFQHSIEMGANGYIQKTADFVRMTSICGGLIEAWLQMADQKFF